MLIKTLSIIKNNVQNLQTNLTATGSLLSILDFSRKKNNKATLDKGDTSFKHMTLL